MKVLQQGKIRNMYDVGKEMVIVTSDRISAFDHVFPDIIPHKGIVLNTLSAFWFDQTKTIVNNHMISINNMDMPEHFRFLELVGRCMLVKKLKMLPFEFIVRGYITGSAWKSYQKTGEICGIRLPAMLQEAEKLSFPLFTPIAKAPEGHYLPVSYRRLKETIGISLASQIRSASLDLYAFCAAYALQKGIIIADTKFEFGLDEKGYLFLADELMTPDSSQFWSATDYAVGRPQESYDKQHLVGWLEKSGWDKNSPPPSLPPDVINTTISKYVKVYETLTERSLF